MRNLTALNGEEFRCFCNSGMFARFVWKKNILASSYKEGDDFEVSHQLRPVGVVKLKQFQTIDVTSNRSITLMIFQSILPQASHIKMHVKVTEKTPRKKKAV